MEQMCCLCVTLDIIWFGQFWFWCVNKGHLWQYEVFCELNSPSKPNEICETITGYICRLCSETRFHPAGVFCSVSLVSSSAGREPDDAVNASRLEVVTHRPSALSNDSYAFLMTYVKTTEWRGDDATWLQAEFTATLWQHLPDFFQHFYLFSCGRS